MKTSSLILTVLGIVAVVSLASIWFFPSVQDFMAGNTMWNGVNKFTDVFRANHIDSLDELPAQPEKTVLISIPYLDYSPDDLSNLKQFVDNGNTLVVMDDLGYGNAILENLGVKARFNHALLLDPLFCYKNEYLPRIIDFAPGIKESGIKSIGFNHATILENVDASRAMAWSSESSFLDSNGNGVRDNGEPEGPFVVAAEFRVGKGSVKLVSDPSLIINTMVTQNENYQFIQYLMDNNNQTENILIDRSHLGKSPMDTSKMSLEALRNILSSPYVILGLILVIFVIIARYALKKGELFG